MTVHISQHPLVAHKLTRIRDTRTEPKKFRELIREISAFMAYEATQDLGLNSVRVTTPLRRDGWCGSRREGRAGSDSARRPWDGRRCMGVDAVRGSLAHRSI